MKEMKMAQFDPSAKGVDEVLAELEKADSAEQKRILAAEVAGKKRKTVLEKYGIDADARYDSTGRELYPWEVTGADMADAKNHPEETDEQRAAREAQAEQDARVAAASDQGGSTDGVGATTSAGAPTGGTTATTATTGASTTATTSGGAGTTR